MDTVATAITRDMATVASNSSMEIMEVCQYAHVVDYGSKWSYEKAAPNWEITLKKRVSACMRRFSSGALVPVRES